LSAEKFSGRRRQFGFRFETAARMARIKLELGKPAPDREQLLRMLGGLMEMIVKHMNDPKTRWDEKLKWSRVLISASDVCNSVLRDVEVDKLKEQVEELEKLVKGEGVKAGEH